MRPLLVFCDGKQLCCVSSALFLSSSFLLLFTWIIWSIEISIPLFDEKSLTFLASHSKVEHPVSLVHEVKHWILSYCACYGNEYLSCPTYLLNILTYAKHILWLMCSTSQFAPKIDSYAQVRCSAGLFVWNCHMAETDVNNYLRSNWVRICDSTSWSSSTVPVSYLTVGVLITYHLI